MARFIYNLHHEGNEKTIETQNPGDIYIEIELEFSNEDFAMEVLAWCEEAKSGDIYDDEDVTIKCL